MQRYNTMNRRTHSEYRIQKSFVVYRRKPSARSVAADRAGSVLIVVIGLLLLLMLVGLTFFSFSNQEHVASEYYADAHKVYNDGPNADSVFEQALEQLIIGPHDDNQQSVLWPGMHSLVPTSLGMFAGNPNDFAVTRTFYPTVPTDRHPNNGGTGKHIIPGLGANGAAPVVDQNFNGQDDAIDGFTFNGFPTAAYARQVNLSGAAQLSPQGMGAANFSRQFIYNSFPAIDVGYTYPDINNMFLAHIGLDPANNLVVVPSFFRPGLMRDTSGAPLRGWFFDQSSNANSDIDPVTNKRIDTTTMMLPAHPGHVSLAWSFNAATNSWGNTATIQTPALGAVNGIPRYLLPAPAMQIAQGAPNQYTGQPNPRTIQPFNGFTGNRTDGSGNSITGQLGVYTNSPASNLDYCVDNDGDSIADGLWFDLGLPVTTLADGRKMIPMVSYQVLDADSLINLNTAGNLSWLQSAAGPLYGQSPAPNALVPTPNASISHSNLGTSRSEINPFWSLTADPTNSLYLFTPNTAANGPNSAFQVYRAVFGRSNQSTSGINSYIFDRVETANMDLLFMLWGRPNFTVNLNGAGREVFTMNNITPGLWGDAANLLNGLSTGVFGNSAPTNLGMFPQPGLPFVDDNGNFLAGVTDAGYLNNGNMTGGDPSIFALPYPLQSPLGQTKLLYPAYAATPMPFNSPQTVLPFSQPLDYTGAGLWTTASPPYGQIANLVQPNANSAAKYLQYVGFQGSIPAYIGYQTAFTQAIYGVNAISYNANNNGVIDEADERVSDPEFATTADQLFSYEETAGLQLTDADYQSASLSTRLKQLMSFNFADNQRAQNIRRRFSTASSDRRQHGFSSAISPTSSGGSNNNNISGNRAWEYSSGNWDGTTATAGQRFQFPPMVLASSKANGFDRQRPVLINNPGPNNPNSTTAAEPFRMELAALIGAKLNDPVSYNNNGTTYTPAPYQYRSSQAASTPWQQQLRLNINRVLSAADPAQPFGSTVAQSAQNPIRYRELTPHPTSTEWNAVSTTVAAQPISKTLGAAGAPNTAGANKVLLFPTATSGTTFASNPALQEYWARRDRQTLARDIYVMLYMFGGGQDNVDYTATSNKGGALYQTYQLYEMAQFAVNVVDSLDRDNVITMFEFDMDLNDGWNLDDDPATNDNNNVDRAVVFGIEAQQLVMNESLVALSRRIPKKSSPGTLLDHPATLLDDSVKDRTFTYLELFNVSPYSVPVNGQNWQIMVLDPTNPASAGGPNAVQPANAISVLTFNDYKNNSVAAGQPYVIASRVYTASGVNELVSGGNGYHGSSFFVDLTWDPAVNPNTNPNFTNTTDAQLANYVQIPAPNGAINLDLVGAAVTTGNPNELNQPFILTQGSQTTANTTVGDFCDLTIKTTAAGGHTYDIDADNGVWTTNPNVQFVLRRRLNLDRPAPHILTDANYATDDGDNPYIEVDRMTYVASTLPAGNATAGTVSANNGQYFNPVDPTGMTAAAVKSDMIARLQLLNSRERKQPLDGDEGSNNWSFFPQSVRAAPPFFSLSNSTSNRVPYYYVASAPTPSQTPNTIGQTNLALTNSPDGLGLTAPGAVTLWQPHFDRDFASVMELLSVPLYSPDFVTRMQVMRASNPATIFHRMMSEFPLPATNGNDFLPLLAQGRFLRPQYPTNIGSGSPMAQLDNRWYRVLELLEVPPRENLQVENTLLNQYPWLFPQGLQRTLGKINLNTLRNGENLFALLDDMSQFDVTQYNLFGGGSQTDGSYADRYEAARDWWSQLRQARDQLDATTGLVLPGTPASRPFRSLSHFDSYPAPAGTTPGDDGRSSLDDTLFRSLPYDVNNNVVGGIKNQSLNGALDQRTLFEARTRGDLATVASGNGNNVDPYTRQRLVSKIAGNTTQRSHVFLVWITVGYFEAYEAVPPQINAGKVTQSSVIQIGAEMPDQTRHRGFFVVDRSLLEEAWVPPTPQNNNTGYYDYSKFVKYRKTLQ